MFFGLNDVAFLAAVGAPALWTPANITTALWLDAADASTITESGGAVSEWNDKSGNGRNASQGEVGSRPSYSATGFNGLPGVTFDGANDRMLHGLTAGGPHTLIAVYKTNSSQTGFRGVISTGSSGSAGSAIYARGTSAFIAAFGAGEITSTAAYSSGQTVTVILEDDNGATTKYFWINGNQSGSFTDNPAGQLLSHIGGSDNQHCSMTVAECLAVSNVPPTDTRQRIEGYLAHKWGLTDNLPADHPYKTAAPTV